MSSIDAPQQEITPTARLRSLAARAGAMEKIMYASIWRALTRNPAVPAGGFGLRYHAPVLTILWIFIALSAVELVIFDLILRQWLVVRIIVLVISIWGLVWMIGLLCSYYMRPHTVGPDGIEIRNGLDTDVAIGWDAVTSVERKKQVYEPKTPKIIDDDGNRILAMNILNETNIEIVLEGPTSITLPGLPPKGGEHVITVARLWADDPKAFLDASRRFTNAP